MTSLQAQQRALAKARSGEAAHHASVAVAGSCGQPRDPVAAPSASPPQRHGDRGSGDDDDSAARRALPTYVRYGDLVAAGIVGNWTTLSRLINVEGFPVGVMLSPNVRAWRLDEVEAWLATRPSDRKSVPNRWRRAAATV
jgi:hypothetical protein